METLDASIRSLRERHRLHSGNQTSHPKMGNAVIIQVEEKNRNRRKFGIIEDLTKGRGGVARGAKVRTAKDMASGYRQCHIHVF